MNDTLVIIYILGEVINTVKLEKRNGDGEADGHFLDRCILMAHKISKEGASRFDEETDTCALFAVDDRTGESHCVWALGVQNEGA